MSSYGVSKITVVLAYDKNVYEDEQTFGIASVSSYIQELCETLHPIRHKATLSFLRELVNREEETATLPHFDQKYPNMSPESTAHRSLCLYKILRKRAADTLFKDLSILFEDEKEHQLTYIIRNEYDHKSFQTISNVRSMRTCEDLLDSYKDVVIDSDEEDEIINE